MSSARVPYLHEGRAVYEWEQSLDEVRVFIRPPPGTRGKDLDVSVTSRRVRVGLKGNPPFLDLEPWSVAVQDASAWTFEDGTLEVSLAKMRKAETWDAAFKGHAPLDPMQRMEVQKRMTLERFQEEHAGFDFSGAEFNGAPPDPREFMGGVKYE